MSTELQPFEFQSNALRVQADEKGNPWFCAKDVCDILGYANDSKSIKDHCKADGVTNRYPIIDALGRTQYPNFISEGNLYRLIIKSSKPEAEPFEAWVCDEVLPSIRKTGSYAMTPQLPPSPETITIPKDEYIGLLAKIVDLQEDRIKLMEFKETHHQNRIPLTDDEKRQIKLMAQQGKGNTEIAKAIGRTDNTVAHWARQFRKEIEGGAQ